MTEYTIESLLDTRERIVNQIEEGKLMVKEGAGFLGMTRQGLWKLRKNYRQYGRKALVGLKRGPKPYNKPWNRTPKEIEERVEELFLEHDVGPVRLSWLLEDKGIIISPSTIYRILVRRRLIFPKEGKRKVKPRYYQKGYPGEEIQLDTTEPFGKGKLILISAIDSYCRWAFAELYWGNTSKKASLFLRAIFSKAPFLIKRVRVDRGSEFQKEFIQACQELNIELIRNPKRCPQKNGKVERLHRTIEEECLWRCQAKPENLVLVKYWLSRWLSWYNTKRRHQGFGMKGKTPKQQLEHWLRKNLYHTYQEVPEVNKTLIQYIIGLLKNDCDIIGRVPPT